DLLQLVVYEAVAPLRRDQTLECLPEILEQLLTPPQIAAVEHCRSYRGVGFAHFDAVTYCPDRIPDIQFHIPEEVQQLLGYLLDLLGLFPVVQEHYVYIGKRVQLGPAVTADSDQSHFGDQALLRGVADYRIIELHYQGIGHRSNHGDDLRPPCSVLVRLLYLLPVMREKTARTGKIKRSLLFKRSLSGVTGGLRLIRKISVNRVFHQLSLFSLLLQRSNVGDNPVQNSLGNLLLESRILEPGLLLLIAYESALHQDARHRGADQDIERALLDPQILRCRIAAGHPLVERFLDFFGEVRRVVQFVVRHEIEQDGLEQTYLFQGGAVLSRCQLGRLFGLGKIEVVGLHACCVPVE